MKTTWIVVADRARARVFERVGVRETPRELQDLVDPDANASEQESTRDRPPRVQDSHGAHRHAIEPRTSAKQKALGRFARRIAEVLEAGRTSHRYDELALVAPPASLGALSEALGPALQQCLVARIAKDYSRSTAAEIGAALDAARE